MGVTFHKSERLSQKRIIDLIFQKKGQSIHKNPLLLVFLETELNTTYPAQVMFSVSKRKFKKAVDRNKVKRQLREAYRLQKDRIYDLIGPNKQYALCVIYLESVMTPYAVIDKQLQAAIDEFGQRIS